VASLAAAGVIAWNLPGPAHANAPAGSPASAPAASHNGDDGPGDDGSTGDDDGSRSASGGRAATAPQPARGSTHSVSGGS
jgi:hypothetical protein